ncbi:hypothetical protein TNCV_1236251 [Trichonephila clavipes]|nr:hypothetical protein TNCV_1236251 [Trichonephila clavipes]
MFIISYYHGTANREVTHSVPPTNHSACFPRPVHSNQSWFPHQTFTSTPLLRPTTTSSTTSLQLANQVAACFPSKFFHYHRQHSLFLCRDGGTLRVPCPIKSYTVSLGAKTGF